MVQISDVFSENVWPLLSQSSTNILVLNSSPLLYYFPNISFLENVVIIVSYIYGIMYILFPNIFSSIV